jgi:tripartite-type tricarboxylate transporter receptor subunit TctC
VASKFFMGAVALAFAWAHAVAEDWPQHSVTVYVPFLAGSTPDAIARTVAERLQGKLGQPFVVENRPGASGNTGTAAVAKAAPDGYTLGVSIVGPLVINALLFPSMPYETARDLAPITILAAQPSVLVAYPGVAANSVPELIALLKEDAGKFTFGSIGRGSLSHLAMEALTIKAGVKVVHLPFAGSPAAVTALMRGDVQLAVLPAGAVVPLGRAGKLKMLAVTSPERSPLLPDLPTLREAGIVGVEADAWVGLIAPAGTPAPLLAKIHDETAAALADPDVVEKLATQYVTPIADSSDEFRAVLQAEHDRWGPIIAASGIKAE